MSGTQSDRAAGRQIVVPRRFEAPAERVFDAWLDAEAAGRWLFATPDGQMQTVQIDPRVGGRFRFVEKRGDTLANHVGTYVELDRPRRLVFTFATSFDETPSRVAIDIRAVEGGCELTLTHEVLPEWAAFAERTQAGWTTILDNLAVALAGPRGAGRAATHELRITRIFDAPRDLVWQAWIEPDRLMHWFCPKDFTVLFATVDARPGGTWRSGMRGPDGSEYIHRGIYRELDRPARLVFTHGWERNHLEPVAETLVTITFTERAGRTTMVFEQVGLATPESAQSHHGGWTEAFDNLAAAL